MPIVAVLAQSAPPPPDTSDHKAMLELLNITSLRPGPAGRMNPDGTKPANYANYDESKATAKSPVPELLAMNDGTKITTPAPWVRRGRAL